MLMIEIASMGLKYTIVITNAELRFGYNVAKSLCALPNVSVIAFGRTKRTMCRGLPNVVKEASYPNPFLDPQGYANSINQATAGMEHVVLIPTHEDIFVATRFKSLT